MGHFEELKRICEITGPIGYPDDMNAYLHEVWAPLGEVTETPVGNVVAHVGGSGPKILLDAHSDEIGYVVRSITDDGFLWITTAQRLLQPRLGLYHAADARPARDDRRARRAQDRGDLRHRHRPRHHRRPAREEGRTTSTTSSSTSARRAVRRRSPGA